MKRIKFLAVIAIPVMLISIPQTSPAQLGVGGSLEAALAGGGPDSQFHTNHIAREYRSTHLSLRVLNLYGFAQMDREWSAITRIQFDTWGTGEMNPPKVMTAYARWQPEASLFDLKVGRFETPFGLYSRRNLPEEADLATPPLIYSYTTNISEERGVWPAAGVSGVYGEDDVGMTLVYLGGVTTGIGGTLYSGDGVWELSTTLANATPASSHPYNNTSSIAIVGRLGASPSPFWKHGVSFAYGTFMRRAAVNDDLNDLGAYRQFLAGMDWVISYTHFELSGEFVFSFWEVPAYGVSGWLTDSSGEAETHEVGTLGWHIDLKYSPPFLPEFFVVGRMEQLAALNFTEPFQASSSPYLTSNQWDHDVYRPSLGIGYRISDSVTWRLMGSSTFVDTRPEPELNVLIGTLTAHF